MSDIFKKHVEEMVIYEMALPIGDYVIESYLGVDANSFYRLKMFSDIEDSSIVSVLIRAIDQDEFFEDIRSRGVFSHTVIPKAKKVNRIQKIINSFKKQLRRWKIIA